MWKFTSVLLSALVLGISSAPALSQEVDFSRVAVFGDSLCDTGNLYYFVEFGEPFSGVDALFPTPPYDNGRFSNGPIWIEEFNGDLAYPSPDPVIINPYSLNFAFGGAETGLWFSQRESPNVGLQIGLFAQGYGGFQGDELIVYWAGGNDFNPLPGMALPSAEDVVANTTDRLEELIALGGNTFLVPNLPPLGFTPQVRQLGPGAELLLNLLVLEHNDLLEQSLRDLEAEYGVRIYRVNTFAIVSAVTLRPEDFGFTNVTDAAFDLYSGQIIGNPDEYVYWDTIHPTSAAHRLLGSISAASLTTQRLLDYVKDNGSDGLAIRGFLSAWSRFDLSLRLVVANVYLQVGELDQATATLECFQDEVQRLARRRRILNADRTTLINQAQRAIDAIDN